MVSPLILDKIWEHKTTKGGNQVKEAIKGVTCYLNSGVPGTVPVGVIRALAFLQAPPVSNMGTLIFSTATDLVFQDGTPTPSLLLLNVEWAPKAPIGRNPTDRDEKQSIWRDGDSHSVTPT